MTGNHNQLPVSLLKFSPLEECTSLGSMKPSTLCVCVCYFMCLFYFTYLSILPDVYTCTNHVHVAPEVKRHYQIPSGTGVTGGCKPPYGFWRLNPVFLREQPVSLTSGTLFQPQEFFLKGKQQHEPSQPLEQKAEKSPCRKGGAVPLTVSYPENHSIEAGIQFFVIRTLEASSSFPGPLQQHSDRAGKHRDGCRTPRRSHIQALVSALGTALSLPNCALYLIMLIIRDTNEVSLVL